MSAELLDIRQVEREWHTDHASSFVGHVATSEGKVSFLREGDEDAEDVYVFVGGLYSGCAYEVPSCVAVNQPELSSTKSKIASIMIRHANKSYSGNVLEIDATEIAETVEVLAPESRIHLFGHSKGTKVALLAAPLIRPSIEVVSIVEVNPVIGTSLTAKNAWKRLIITPKTLAQVMDSVLRPPVPVSMPKHMSDGVDWEIKRRSGAIAAETISLLFMGKDIKEVDLKRARDRGHAVVPKIMMVAASDDDMTRWDHIQEGMSDEGIVFDETLFVEEPGLHDHLAFLREQELMQRILEVETLMLSSEVYASDNTASFNAAA